MSRLDSLYKKNHIIETSNQPVKKSRRVAFPLYYFYRSLRVVLVMWILLLIVVVVSPWADYYIEKSIKSDEPKVLGVEAPTPNVTVPVTIPVKSVAPNFYFKKGLSRQGEAEADDLEIKAPIVEGISDIDLTKGLGHHPDSVWPNEKGNVVVAGHSFSLDADNPYGEVFANLRQIEINDQVTVTYQNKKYIYKIFKKEIVAAKDMSLMGQADAWQLTFYTCDPPKTDWRRLVFQAELVKIE